MINREFLKDLKNDLKKIRSDIEKAKAGYRNVWSNGDERSLFEELVFCLLTPQSGAYVCWEAVGRLRAQGTLYSGGFDEIRDKVYPVRFLNNKARYIISAREYFTENGKIAVRKHLGQYEIVDDKRRFLIDNIKGIGWKEASHYLRNIGFGKNIAILDRHILKNMLKLGIINEIPKSLTPGRYMEIEDKLRKFCRREDIPMESMDLLLWQRETGSVFK